MQLVSEPSGAFLRIVPERGTSGDGGTSVPFGPRYDTPRFADGDAFLFGAETRGLPAEVLAQVPETQRLYLPMRPDNRSLNLSNAVAVVAYEAWRQLGFAGMTSSAGAIK